MKRKDKKMTKKTDERAPYDFGTYKVTTYEANLAKYSDDLTTLDVYAFIPATDSGRPISTGGPDGFD